jgi:hypothetical protein
MPGIWHIASPPWEQDLFVAGAFERTAHVWSLGRAAEVACVDTVFDFGGRRLGLVTGDEPVIVAGAWERHGVCGYSLAGQRLWQNKKRSAVQHVTALASGRVAVGYARGPATVLDAATGQEMRSLRGVTGVHALTQDMSLLASNTYARLADAELEPMGRRIPLRSFAVLDAAASDRHVALAEAGGPLRILDLDGAERATHTVADGHTLTVTYERASGTWRALTRVDRGDDVDYGLVRLSDDGEVLEQRPFDAVTDATWLRDGAVLVYGNERGVVFLLDAPEDGARRLDIVGTCGQRPD